MLHRRRGAGGNFRILGLTFDPELLMGVGVHEVACEAGWRLRALLRPKRFFAQHGLVHLYKAQVLSYVEATLPGYFHAGPSVLSACKGAGPYRGGAARLI